MIDELIEDYKKKIKTLEISVINIKELFGSNTKLDETIIRLKTKQSCYRTFITELERLKQQTI